jgi:hypothetical protein
MGEVIRKLGALDLFSLDPLGLQPAHLFHMAAQTPQKIGIFRKPLGQNVARTFQRGFGIWHRLGDIARRKRGRIGAAVGENRIVKRLQPIFARNHRAGATLGLIGQIDVLQLGLGGGLDQRKCQRIGHLALFGDRGHDGRPPGLHLAQIGQAFGKIAQLGVIKAARHLFAVTRNERHRRTFVQKLNRCRDLRCLRPDFLRDQLRDLAGVGHALAPLQEARP